LRQKRVYLACFILHFLLITTISCRDTLWLVAHKLTILPWALSGPVEKAESIASGALGQNLAPSNPTRRALLTYLHIAGIEKGYGYFAPNVPGSFKLAFELHYPDGRVEYELPRVNSAGAGLRVAGLLDEIARTRYDPLREYLVKMVARSIWRDHPGATTIRAVFGTINLPSIAEFEQGERESYQFLYAYDFSLRDDSGQSQKP
jgi:hypothetical protein